MMRIKQKINNFLAKVRYGKDWTYHKHIRYINRHKPLKWAFDFYDNYSDEVANKVARIVVQFCQDTSFHESLMVLSKTLKRNKNNNFRLYLTKKEVNIVNNCFCRARYIAKSTGLTHDFPVFKDIIKCQIKLED